MPQDNKNFGKPGQPNQPARNTPGQNPSQNPGGQKPGQTPQQGKPQGFAENKGGAATWTNNEIVTLKQLASENAPVSAISSKLGKTEDVVKAKAKELQLTLTSW